MMVTRPKKEGRLPIMELFGPTIQGEGIMTGTVTHFLRTGGCGLRCEWCDSMFSVDPKLIRKHRSMMTTAEILEAIAQLSYAPYITFTGGDPCMHKRLGEIVTTLNMRGMRVAVETQGEMFPEWLGAVDVITFSPKGPSSGNTVNIGDLLEWLKTHAPRRPFKVCIKVVVFHEEDFKYAMHVYNSIPANYYDAFYFTAGTLLTEDIEVEEGSPEGYEYTLKATYVLRNLRAIADLILEESRVTSMNDKVHIGCQQHVLLWPDKEKGV